MKSKPILAIVVCLLANVLTVASCNGTRTNTATSSPSILLTSTTATQILTTSSQTSTKPIFTTSKSTISYTLTTSVPSGGGRIDVTPVSSNGSYASGTVVTLLAITDQDHAFDSWGGDASGINTTTTILMNSNKSVTAYFVPM